MNRHNPPKTNAWHDVASLRRNILGGLKVLGLNVTNLDECRPLAEEVASALAIVEAKHQRELEQMACQLRAQEDMLLLIRDSLRCGADAGWEERAAKKIDEVLKGVEFEDHSLPMLDIDNEENA